MLVNLSFDSNPSLLLLTHYLRISKPLADGFLCPHLVKEFHLLSSREDFLLTSVTRRLWFHRTREDLSDRSRYSCHHLYRHTLTRCPCWRVISFDPIPRLVVSLPVRLQVFPREFFIDESETNLYFFCNLISCMNSLWCLSSDFLLKFSLQALAVFLSFFSFSLDFHRCPQDMFSSSRRK